MKRLAHLLGYGASIYLPLFLSGMLLLFIPETSYHNDVLSYSKLFWFTGLVFVLTNAVGLIYGSPWHQEQVLERNWLGWDRTKRLIVSYVSRGDNVVALERAITASKLLLEDMGVQYWIEAITDTSVWVGADQHIVVPKSYQTAKFAKYKARALHYASQTRRCSSKDYIIHLDEESILTPEVIRGLDKFIHNGHGLERIGQGEIKYNAHEYGKNLLITCVDSIRTGDDLGRFRTQYKLFGRPLFGMHGSFFVVPALLEQNIGFDLSTRGSITEDAYFALICADQGIGFEWVEGFIREQSPFTLLELLKQRRRWITGLRLLMWDKTISRKQRLLLGVNMTLWRAAWVGPIITAWNILAGGSIVPVWAEVLSAFLSGMVIVVYMVGAYRNVTGIGLARHRQLLIWIMSGLLVPISCAIEGIAVLYAIVRPIAVFEVVNK